MRTQGTGVGGAKRGARRPDLRERRVKTQSREETKKVESTNDPPSTVVATRAIPFLRCMSRTFFSDSNNSDVNAIQPDGVRSPTTRSSADHPPPPPPTSKTFITPAVAEHQTRATVGTPSPFSDNPKNTRATRDAMRSTRATFIPRNSPTHARASERHFIRPARRALFYLFFNPVPNHGP